MAEPNSPREAVEQHRTGGSRFKEGDVVVLKSGGPKMTVIGFGDTGLLNVNWFAGTELKRDCFADIELDPAA